MVTQRSMKQFNQKAFLEDLSKVPFSTAHVFDDPDDVYQCREKLYNRILDDHAPTVSFKKSKTPAVDPNLLQPIDIRKVMRQRDRFKRKFNKSRSPNEWENYRNKVVSMRRKVVKERFTILCEETRGNQRKFWTTISLFINYSRKKCKYRPDNT